MVNQLKYMMMRWMRSVECLMMSRKPPLAELLLGLVSTIWSGSTGIPFFLLAADRTFRASSIFDLESILPSVYCLHVIHEPGYQPPGRLWQPEQNNGTNTDHGGYSNQVERIITESVCKSCQCVRYFPSNRRLKFIHYLQ